MKILLVSSYTMEYVTRIDRCPPISLLYLAAVLREAGHTPHILDLDVLPKGEKADRETFLLQSILDAINDVQPGMVGLNCLLSGHFPFVRRAAAAIKESHGDLRVVIGGIHPTLFAEDILRNCPDIDAVVLGEGERQVTALASGYADAGNGFLNHIEALAFRGSDGSIVVNPRKSYIRNLDELPLPAYDLVRMEDYYADHSSWHNPRKLDIKMSVPVLSSRSCPYDCSFCSAKALMGRGLRLRNPVRVVDEMESLYQRHGLNYFGFVDDNLTLNKSHILSICDEIVRRGMNIQFESYNGYNLSSLDEEIVDAMVSAGCVYVILPIEHGNDRMRNEIIGKHLPVEKIHEVVSLYKRHDLLTRGVFIMGFPEDTPQTLQDTYDLIHALQLDMNTVFNLIPFPGTRIFEQALRDDLFVESVEVGRLWEGAWDLNALENQFYLKPYGMSLEELGEYRRMFDGLRLLTDRVKVLQGGHRSEDHHE